MPALSFPSTTSCPTGPAGDEHRACPPAWSGARSAALALATLALLVRNILAIPAHVPLDPNEGWNAAHALAAMAGHGLYPRAASADDQQLSAFVFLSDRRHRRGMAATPSSPDAGSRLPHSWPRWPASRRCCGGWIAARARWSWAALFFAALLLITSDYVGMDDPQLLGPCPAAGRAAAAAAQTRVVAPRLLFAVSLFIKHNLLAMPLAAGLWLLAQDRRTGAAIPALGPGLRPVGACPVPAGLWHQPARAAGVAAPVLTGQSSGAAITHLWWAALPVDRHGGLLARPAQPVQSALCGRRAAAGAWSLPPETAWTPTPSSILASRCRWRWAWWRNAAAGRWLSAASALPLLIFLAVNFQDNNFFFTRDFAQSSARDIAFLKSRPGPPVRSAFAVPVGRQGRRGGCLQCRRSDQDAAPAIPRRWSG